MMLYQILIYHRIFHTVALDINCIQYYNYNFFYPY
jgi:hypothetical protein